MISIGCLLGVIAFCRSIRGMECVVKLCLFLRDIEVITPRLSMNMVPWALGEVVHCTLDGNGGLPGVRDVAGAGDGVEWDNFP